MSTARTYGSWPSPVTAELVAHGRREYGFPQFQDGLWWQERRPEESGRTAILHEAVEPLAGVDARTRVHEYGGRSYLALPDGGFVFVKEDDQRMYRTSADGQVTVLTPDDGARYADFTLSPDGTEVWCVRESEHAEGVTRAVVAVPLAGGEVRVLVAGADFYACPTASPDGRRLVVLSWNHPQMPWDGTCLQLVQDGTTVTLLGGPGESVLAPVWKDDSSLYVISDRSGWWNLYELAVDGSALRPLCPIDEEFAQPLWELGGRPYGILEDGRLAVLHGRGDQRLAVLDPEDGTLQDLDLPYTTWHPALAVSGSLIAGTAAAPDLPWSLVTVDVAGGWTPVATPVADLPDPIHLPRPSELVARGRSGRSVSAYVYPPSDTSAGPAPYVVFVHGGPTGHVGTDLDLGKAFFTSRGIGVADVNYAGSSGYGRAHRERLRGQWGVADVEDVVAIAEELARAGLADPARIAVRGGSAGGWTVLAAITATRVFSAATSYYGLSTVEGFSEESHDFESRYVSELIGPVDPSTREPLARAHLTSCPVLLLQGLDDPVVPPSQSTRFADALKRAGMPYAYLEFPGESHGFRKQETIIRCLEAELSFYGQCFGFTPPGIPPLDLA
ncbi:S9 family peptidase [Acrocarpospora macrocephala]|uniref:S9 family peptidase n=1 Tax=Acrocarpospora macrocephala TaxID=150177 RepID=UPI0012D32638|nr:prolyl oligopeptidase family serine peptidase [Acrocarpospora macrocephala]